MNRNRFATRLFLAVLIPLVAACGWQLRGMGPGATLPEDLRVHIAGNTAVASELRQTLEGSATLVNTPADADLTLQILDERFDQRTATISASARVSERRLTQEVQYVILGADGQPVFPPGRADIERIYEYNEENVLATDDEVVLLRREMQQDLVRQLQMRLNQAATNLAGSNAAAP